MHELLRRDRVGRRDRAELGMGAEIAVAVAESVVHLGHEGAGCAIAQGDPEADRVEVEPQVAGLGEQADIDRAGIEPVFGQHLAKPGRPAAFPARPAMIPVVQGPEVEAVARDETGEVVLKI